MDKKDPLRLKNQLCFPLYACARQVVNAYRPFLHTIYCYDGHVGRKHDFYKRVGTSTAP